MFTPEGKHCFGRLLRIHRLDQTLWPSALARWFDAKGGFIEYDSLPRTMLIEWLSEAMGWPELNDMTYVHKYGRMESWSDATKPQKGGTDIALLTAIVHLGFLSLPASDVDRVQRVVVRDMVTVVSILQGRLDPF